MVVAAYEFYENKHRTYVLNVMKMYPTIKDCKHSTGDPCHSENTVLLKFQEKQRIINSGQRLHVK